MRIVEQAIVIQAPAEQVFAYTDDIRNMGFHMSEKSSMPMMGSKLKLEILTPQPTGVGATYRYSGKMMGLTIDFSETVTKYVPNREKIWHTIGEPKLIIMSGYEMRTTVEPLSPDSSRLRISIAYDLPASGFWNFVGVLLGDWYSRWCLRQMTEGTRQALAAQAATGGQIAPPRAA